MSTKPHEASAIPLTERVDYLMIIASMAGADVLIAPEETEKLRQLCRELGLPERETEQILAAGHRPTAAIARHLDALRSSPLRFTLLSDCLSLAYADGEYASGERKEIVSLARALQIDDAQLGALEECARTLREAAAQRDGEGDLKHRAEKVASQLAAVGIPLGMLGTASAAGLAGAGVSSGLGAVAMGFGVATGFGAVLGLSVGTILGVRWLHAKLKGDEPGAAGA